ncbi:chaplin [Yinghuangia sp. YIM S09857]|uniref:chaplin n=1 Tax=Yinghuangia sp. YIM S09857 TaxID=3436929 RepID=UPI003F5335F8
MGINSVNEFAKKTVVAAAMVGSAFAFGGGTAYASSAADGAAVGSPGVLSGNLLQVPVHVPVNLCGNTVSVIGALNPAFGNTCINADGDMKPPTPMPPHTPPHKPPHKPPHTPPHKPPHNPPHECPPQGPPACPPTTPPVTPPPVTPPPVTPPPTTPPVDECPDEECPCPEIQVVHEVTDAVTV